MWRAGEEGKGKWGPRTAFGATSTTVTGDAAPPRTRFRGCHAPRRRRSRARRAGGPLGAARGGGDGAGGRREAGPSLAPSLGRPVFAPPPRRSPVQCSAARARTAPGTGSVGARDESAPGTNLPVRYKGGGELLARIKGRAKRGPRAAGRRRGERGRGSLLLSLLAPTQHLAARHAHAHSPHTRARALCFVGSLHAHSRRRAGSSAAAAEEQRRNKPVHRDPFKKKKKMSSAKAQAGRQAAHDYSVRVVNEDLCKREPVLATVLAWGWLLKQVRGRRDWVQREGVICFSPPARAQAVAALRARPAPGMVVRLGGRVPCPRRERAPPPPARAQ
jgi:hypothetical protein